MKRRLFGCIIVLAALAGPMANVALAVPPNNDDFAFARGISGSSGSVAGSNVQATVESGEGRPCSSSGVTTVWYRWQAPADGPVTFDTDNGSRTFDTVLAAYTGGSIPNLAQIVCNDDSGGSTASYINFTAEAGVVYSIQVNSYSSSTGGFALDWSQPGSGNSSLTAPTYRFAQAGVVSSTRTIPIEVNWTASDPEGISSTQLQMQKDGGAWSNVALASPTATTVKRPLQFGHTYNFQVRITDGQGNTTSYLAGVPFDLANVQENEGIAFTGAWSRTLSSNFMGGGTQFTTARNASAFLAFEGRAVAWIGTKGTTFGSSTVTMDDGLSVGTKSQRASATKYRNIIHRYSWTQTGQHNIRVTCQATAGHPRCDVDGFAIIV